MRATSTSSSVRRAAVGCLAILSVAVGATGQGGGPPPVATVQPKDDAARDPGFGRFRAHVREVARTCAEPAVRALLAPAPGTTPDAGDPGTDEFWKTWSGSSAGIGPLCQALERALSLGAVREAADTYCAPYVSCRGGPPDALPFGRYLIGVSARVRVRAAPTPDGEVLAEAPFPVLIDCTLWREACQGRATDPPPAWRGVRLRDVVGYASAEDVRNQHEPRVRIRRVGTSWRIIDVASAD